mgnify:CR=1 FL=1
MQKIMFNDKYNLTKAVLEGRKTQTRRIAYTGNATIIDCGICIEQKNFGRATLFRGIDEIVHSRYNIGEEVAVAQPYRMTACKVDYNEKEIKEVVCSIGWANKMYVKADLMPHRIRITDIRAERLQDISKDDCLAEGIKEIYETNVDDPTEFYGYAFLPDASPCPAHCYCEAQEAYAALIDKISGKGTWASNPYVFVYEFELVK